SSVLDSLKNQAGAPKLLSAAHDRNFNAYTRPLLADSKGGFRDHTGSQLTRRWRKPDSNSQSHPQERVSFGDKPTQIPKAMSLQTNGRRGWGKGHGHFLPMMFRVAPCAKMAPQLVSRVSPGLRAEDRVPTRRGKTMAATLHRGDGHMAQKGRGIFMVYVDIDAQHVQEFNKWYNKEHLPELLSVPGILSAARYEAVK